MNVGEVEERVFSEPLGLSEEQRKSLLMLIRSVEPENKKELLRALGRQYDMVSRDIPDGSSEPNARTFWNDIFRAVWKKAPDF